MDKHLKQRPFLYIWLCFSAGIFASSILSIPFIIYLAASALIIVCLIFAKNNSWILLFFMLSALLGSMRLNQADNLFNPRTIANDRIETEGFISDKRNGRLVLRSTRIKTPAGFIPFNHKILIYKNGISDKFNIGDKAYFTGKLTFSEKLYFNSFHYGRTLKYAGINYVAYLKNTETMNLLEPKSRYAFKRFIYAARNAASNIFDARIGKPFSAFVKAITLGIKDELSSEMASPYRKTGTAHILAISGLHVGLITYMLFIVFSVFRFNLRTKNLAVIAGIIIYCAITGMSVSTVRASLIAVIYFTGLIIKREPDIYNSLGLAGFIILLVNPWELFKPGYLMSFSAVISIVSGMNLFEIFYKAKRSQLVNLMLISAFAWIGTMPLTAYFFKIITPAGILCNLYTIPLAFLTIASGFCVLIFHLIFPYLADICGISLTFFAWLNHVLNSYMAALSWTHFRIENFSQTIVFIYYLLCLLIYSSLKTFSKMSKR